MNIEELKRLGEKWANLPEKDKEAAEIADYVMDKLPELLSRIEQLEIELGAWKESFGTSQLTHALAKLEHAKKACAEMRGLLLEIKPTIPAWITDEAYRAYEARIIHALSSTCGSSYIHRDEIKPLVEALRFILEECNWQDVIGDGGDDRIGLACKEALAHAARLKGETK